ncbi:DUF5804 family protein [Natronobacterium gregoryi]|uniref:Uncharacterized protein n=2 Tax=Natronobacterium gregoryi TaxID=44930 RepID=L0AKP3_NATGS|nr:DUF5804 family protein [Natronobacterium gregoryi]AFZ74473.1 hypothetical protein Natgr_3350 [Natronobacterium gregoryi SP2]ELY72457.1 hypothetical protein C490_03898 [Natronobacterium gregoryi SP2]PLK21780.1 hypothetical protein CYV19_02815 [Natronobacterium gregoryi SP2]SFJ45816.1 hypothetical protein SAMN05443661_13114 [Natronobacterium gregoryi]
MTRVCLVGNDDVDLKYELLSRETSREALATYALQRPFDNSLAVRTVSIGAAVSLLNDLQWYLTRFVDEAFVQEPSISDEEWLSRSLATALRNGDLEPAATDEFCKVYGLETVDRHPVSPSSRDKESTDADAETTQQLVEPLYVRRTDGDLPAYDLRDVEETLVVRLTEAEYSP